MQIDEKEMYRNRFNDEQSAKFNEAMEIAEAKQREADKEFKKEYGSMKTRIMEPAKNATEKRKRQRKAAKAARRKNR